MAKPRRWLRGCRSRPRVGGPPGPKAQHLLVAFIFDTELDRYRRELTDARIPTVDCNDNRILGGAWRVPGSIHPDGRGHQCYAACIARGLVRLGVEAD